MALPETISQDESFAKLFNLLPEDLRRRDLSTRFNTSEKLNLAETIRITWNEAGNFNKADAEIIRLRNGLFNWGDYPDGEAFVHSHKSAAQLREVVRGKDIYATVNMEDADDVLAVRAVLDFLESRRVVLGTMYFPYQRGERADLVVGDPDKRLVVLVKTLARDLAVAGVDGLVMVDSHSPAFSWYCLKYGVRALDLTYIPGMLKSAVKQGFLESENLYVAGGDDGAKEMGYFLAKLTSAKGILEGKKTKGLTGTVVTFTDEELSKINGADVIMGEDIISTGGTMAASVGVLLEAGAAKVVILATYPIFAGNALERLGFDDRVKIITTDGRTPKNNISTSSNITVLPVKNLLHEVLTLDRSGIDFWSNEGIIGLEELGFAMAPWQYSPDKLEMPMV